MVSYAYAPHLGAWTHIVGTYNGSQLALYVNAELKGTQPLSSIISTQKPIIIGVGNTGSSYYFTGSMEKAIFFDKALTPEEIQKLYQE